MFGFLIFVGLFFAVNVMSAEGIIPVLVGAVASLGITQFIKQQTGLYGLGAMFLAVAISFVIGFIALVVSTYFSGTQIDWFAMPDMALQLFALATISYKTLMGLTES